MNAHRFPTASTDLANRASLPTGPGLGQQQYAAAEVDKIILGKMLAQVAVVPMPGVDTITVVAHGGDSAMLAALRGTVTGRTLRLEGTLPFKPGTARTSGSVNYIGGNVTVTGMTVINGRVVSGTTVTGSGSLGDTVILDGREVDLDRSIQLVVVIPARLDLAVRDLIGAVGITDDLAGFLDFAPSVRCDLVAAGVNDFEGELRGSGRVTVAAVAFDADVQVTGSGTCVLGSVAGAADLKISGSGDVTVQGGTTTRLRAQVTGSGDIRHGGTVTGKARLRVSGSGDIRVHTVTGEVDQGVAGSGEITANGQTYRPRWH
ncbi:GIN domain-containing protein [Glycomyces sp. MUSA5-2]|uniref:GIN domain-containing protein n=1 Tax=Glycomyces sp. MUSA5-2 TaxID=2053002 RepID=UPI0030080003